jgi:hypothetical protein
MADYARPLFRHKFSKTQAMADYEARRLTRTTRNRISQAFDVQVIGAWRAEPYIEYSHIAQRCPTYLENSHANHT